ncbi:MAG: 50S ribosomal protein L20 [Chitinispirillaceae bacterium]|nr:50S ribosomal protein L20 [Chitinispirillaceae bacterium]
MPRAKNRVASREKRKKIVASAKGYFGRRKDCYALAKDAVIRAGCYAYRDRKQRKRQFRRLWIMRINAAAKLNGLNYSKFMAGLKEKGIELNRKVLAHLALHEPDAFKAIADAVKA